MAERRCSVSVKLHREHNFSLNDENTKTHPDVCKLSCGVSSQQESACNLRINKRKFRIFLAGLLSFNRLQFPEYDA